MPGKQGTHAVAAGPEKVPRGHRAHAAWDCEVEPLGPYVPAMQGVPRHAVLPDEYVPGGHAPTQAAAPWMEYVPGEQGEQLAAPAAE